MSQSCFARCGTQSGFAKFTWKQLLWKLVVEILPVIQWVPKYDWRKNLKGDIVGGITCGITVIPQGMAYAKIAGLPPIYGMYCAFLPPIIYFFFGSSPQLIVGPTAVVSLLVKGSIKESEMTRQDLIDHIMLVTFLCGIVTVVLGALRIGTIVSNFLSHCVITGFTSAAAIIIGFGQIPNLLGLDHVSSSTYFYEVVIEVANEIPKTNFWSLGIGLLCVAIMIAFRFFPKVSQIVPSVLVVVILGILSCWLLKLDEKEGVAVVGHVPHGVPPLSPPKLLSFHNVFVVCLPKATLVALIGFLEAFSVGSSFGVKNKYELNANQELIGLGMANFFACFFSSYAATGSFSRTAVNDRAGGRTGFANMLAALLVLLTLLFLTKLFYYLPETVLAAVIITSVINLFDVKEVKYLWRTNKTDLFVFATTFVCTLGLGIEIGIAVGIGASLLALVIHISRPKIIILGRKQTYYLNQHCQYDDHPVSHDGLTNLEYDEVEYQPSSTHQHSQQQQPHQHSLTRFVDMNEHPDAKAYDGIVIMRIEESIVFVNLSVIKHFVRNLVVEQQHQTSAHTSLPSPSSSPTHTIIIDLASCNYMDASAVHSLRELQKETASCVTLLLSHVKPHVYGVLERGGFVSQIGKEKIFHSIEEAVAEARNEHRRLKHNDNSIIDVYTEDMTTASTTSHTSTTADHDKPPIKQPSESTPLILRKSR